MTVRELIVSLLEHPMDAPVVLRVGERADYVCGTALIVREDRIGPAPVVWVSNQ